MMKPKSLLTVAVAALGLLVSAGAKCTHPLVRKEWRSLTQEEQLAYLAAVKCMMATPPRTTLYMGVQSAYDDYQGLHISMTEQIHFVGQFLPWHRGMLAIWEADLRATCGYEGAQPYWDWTLDAVSEDAWFASPVLDDVYGFGGNSEYLEDISNLTSTATLEIPNRTGGQCLMTGPFANLTVPMGPGSSVTYTPHCLRRDFSATLAVQTLSRGMLDFELEADSFWEYDRRVEVLNLTVAGVTTHGGGHFGVGGQVGELSDMWSSPGDPLFYLHHGKLDFEWNKWQRLNWSYRETDIGGPDTMWAYPYNFVVDPAYQNITLAYELAYGQLGATVNISQVMDITSGVLCYTYE